MAYEFKKYSEIEALTEVPENATVLAEVDGDLKRVPSSGLGSSSSGGAEPDLVLRINTSAFNMTESDITIDSGSASDVFGKIQNGTIPNVVIRSNYAYSSIYFAGVYTASCDINITNGSGQVIVTWIMPYALGNVSGGRYLCRANIDDVGCSEVAKTQI